MRNTPVDEQVGFDSHHNVKRGHATGNHGLSQPKGVRKDLRDLDFGEGIFRKAQGSGAALWIGCCTHR